MKIRNSLRLGLFACCLALVVSGCRGKDKVTVVVKPQFEYERIKRVAVIDFKNSTVFTIRVNLSDVPDEVLFQHRSRAYMRFYLNPMRALRVMRDHPRPMSVPYYIPMFLERTVKGMFGKE